jgi:hypothetical protein
MPTAQQVIRQQKEDAARAQQALVTTHPAALPAVLGNRSVAEQYVDEYAPSSIAGQLVKFSKEGKFIIAETDEEIDPNEDFIALVDETLVGWIKFNGEGAPPERHQGLLYQGFVMPKRESLGDTDESQWPEGLSGKPNDPWQHQVCLVLQSVTTQALYTFTTSSQTGRRAVTSLMSHYNRMQHRDPDAYPVVKLKPSGFEHKDSRVGWVHTPMFVVCGRTPKNTAAKPDTSVAGDMNDSIPF